jgi:hypothetical protein
LVNTLIGGGHNKVLQSLVSGKFPEEERIVEFPGSRNRPFDLGRPAKSDLRKLDYHRPMERRSIAVTKVQKRREAGLCGACGKSPCECRKGARKQKFAKVQTPDMNRKRSS